MSPVTTENLLSHETSEAVQTMIVTMKIPTAKPRHHLQKKIKAVAKNQAALTIPLIYPKIPSDWP